MKIVLVSTSSGSRGGGEFYLRSLALGLIAEGHEVLTLFSTGSQMDELAATFTSDGLQILRFAYTNTYQRRLRVFGAVFDFLGRRRIAQLLKSLSPDIIHINQQNIEDGLDLILAAQDTNLPAISTIHVTRSMTSLGAVAGQFRDFIAKVILRRTSVRFIGISNVSAMDLAQMLMGRREVETPEAQADSGLSRPTPTSRVRATRFVSVYCVPNGIVRPVAGQRIALRQGWGVPDGSIVIGIVARLEQQKNPLFMISLLGKLPSNVHVVWIGDGRMRKEFENSKSLFVAGTRIHLDGWRADAASRMAGFDIFALPSHYEGLPLAILEAMSLGLPCVVSDVDGNRDAVVQGTTGFLCPVSDLGAWSRAILSLIESPEQRTMFGEAARERHRAEFSVERMAARTATLYKRVIRGRS